MNVNVELQRLAAAAVRGKFVFKLWFFSLCFFFLLYLHIQRQTIQYNFNYLICMMIAADDLVDN